MSSASHRESKTGGLLGPPPPLLQGTCAPEELQNSLTSGYPEPREDRMAIGFGPEDTGQHCFLLQGCPWPVPHPQAQPSPPLPSSLGMTPPARACCPPVLPLGHHVVLHVRRHVLHLTPQGAPHGRGSARPPHLPRGEAGGRLLWGPHILSLSRASAIAFCSPPASPGSTWLH